MPIMCLKTGSGSAQAQASGADNPLGHIDSGRCVARRIRPGANKDMWGRVLITLALASSVASCGDECSEYSEFTCKQIETADYNVWFSFPSGNDAYHLGRAKGLSQCGQIAYSFAASKDLTPKDGWGYVCCMITKDSSCYEKHR
jgi:hypothetical protein